MKIIVSIVTGAEIELNGCFLFIVGQMGRWKDIFVSSTIIKLKLSMTVKRKHMKITIKIMNLVRIYIRKTLVTSRGLCFYLVKVLIQPTKDGENGGFIKKKGQP